MSVVKQDSFCCIDSRTCRLREFGHRPVAQNLMRALISGVLVLAFSNAGGGQLNGVNLKFESGLGEEVSMYVDAFLVLNDKVKFQREQLQLGERLPLSFRPGGQGL